VCGADAYCGGAGCTGNTVANVCDALETVFLLDGQPVDDAMADQLLAAFQSECADGAPRATIVQTSSSALNQMTGQPVVDSGELVVVLGGPFGQYIVNYLEDNKLTRSYNQYDASTSWFYGRASEGADPVLVMAPHSTLSADHDFFVIETVIDPISRARVIKVYGLDAAGTKAATWFFVNRVFASPASYGGTHYIYEWTDSDAEDGPSDGDTFTEIVAE
jgi:hypothetical protein